MEQGNRYRPAENIGMKKGALDIDQIIQDVQRENLEEEVRLGGQTTVAPSNIRGNVRELEKRKVYFNVPIHNYSQLFCHQYFYENCFLSCYANFLVSLYG